MQLIASLRAIVRATITINGSTASATIPAPIILGSSGVISGKPPVVVLTEMATWDLTADAGRVAQMDTTVWGRSAGLTRLAGALQPIAQVSFGLQVPERVPALCKPLALTLVLTLERL